MLSRMWPKWAGLEEPGARSPSAWLERRNVEILSFLAGSLVVLVPQPYSARGSPYLAYWN